MRGVRVNLTVLCLLPTIRSSSSRILRARSRSTSRCRGTCGLLYIFTFTPEKEYRRRLRGSVKALAAAEAFWASRVRNCGFGETEFKWVDIDLEGYKVGDKRYSRLLVRVGDRMGGDMTSLLGFFIPDL